MSTTTRVLVAVGLLGSAVLAQTWYESLDVTVVDVDVVVTDQDGNPVRGLAREDFVVLEDGKEVALTNFAAIEAGRRLASGDAIDGRESDPPAPVAEAEAAPGLSLLVVIDESSLQPQNRNRLIESVGEAVDGMLRPGDRAMVAVNTGKVELLQALTADHALVRQALDGVATRAGGAGGAMLDFAQLIREMESLGQSPGGSGRSLVQNNTESEARGVFAGIRNYAQSRYQDATRTTGAIREWVNSLAALPGRKAVLMLSDGFARNPGEVLGEAWFRKFGDAVSGGGADLAALNEFDTSRLFLELADHANANRVTFYTISGESRAMSATSAEFGGLDGRGERVWTTALQSQEDSNVRGALETLAEHTGGRAGNGFGGSKLLLERMRRDLDDYYSLAYTPPQAREGASRDIEVRLADPRSEYRLRFREGYRDKTVEERLDDQALSVMLLGESENPLGVEMRLGRRVPGPDKGLVDVPLTVRVPLSNVVLVPGATHHEGRLLVAVASRDDKGRLSPVTRVVVPVRVPNEEILSVLEQAGGWSTTLRLREGPHRIGVAVRDLVGATDSAIWLDDDPERQG